MTENNAAIVLAAGQGKRMNSPVQKQFLEIGGKPVLYYSLKCFEESPLISEIVLVTGAEQVGYVQHEIVDKFGFKKVRSVVPGGKERYDSVYEGLKAVESRGAVFIHDGARPFISEEILERCYLEVQITGACITAVPSKDTVKLDDGNGAVSETPDRSRVWIIQTPQVFRYSLILGAHEKIREEGTEGITDDAMIIESVTDVPVRFAMGDYRNIKITTPEDLLIAEAFASEQARSGCEKNNENCKNKC